MFLHFFTEDMEKKFFLDFAYLLAVAEKESNTESIPTPAYSDNPEKGEYEFEEFAPGFSMKISELLMLRKFADEIGMTYAPASSYKFSPNSVADMLKVAMAELNNISDRSVILKKVLADLFAQANVGSFSVQKKKAILMEVAAMAYADGTVSENEQELLVYFCDRSHLDKELLEEFKDITQEFSKIYVKIFKLITE